jgi:hypothetical protein
VIAWRDGLVVLRSQATAVQANGWYMEHLSGRRTCRPDRIADDGCRHESCLDDDVALCSALLGDTRRQPIEEYKSGIEVGYLCQLVPVVDRDLARA